MRRMHITVLGCVLLLLLAPQGCRRATPPSSTEEESPSSAAALLNVPADQISGPYTHENLALFLITAPSRDDRDYLTLDEGLGAGLVKINEKDQEQVTELILDNRSDQPLYLQEGERLQGGKQDRVIVASLVIGPRSGPRNVPTFCVEQSRWTEGVRARSFGSAFSVALAPKGVRGAAKVENDQNSVWVCVGAHKKTAQLQFAAANTNSSLNETLDSPSVQKVSREYAEALRRTCDKHSDATGLVILVNGQFEEANVYPNKGVFRKLCPRLIESYAVHAVMLRDQKKQTVPATGSMVQLLNTDRARTAAEPRHIDTHNTLEVRPVKKNLYRCITHYDGKMVHWQLLARNGGSDNLGREDDCKRGALLGSDW